MYRSFLIRSSANALHASYSVILYQQNQQPLGTRFLGCTSNPLNLTLRQEPSRLCSSTSPKRFRYTLMYSAPRLTPSSLPSLGRIHSPLANFPPTQTTEKPPYRPIFASYSHLTPPNCAAKHCPLGTYMTRELKHDVMFTQNAQNSYQYP